MFFSGKLSITISYYWHFRSATAIKASGLVTGSLESLFQAVACYVAGGVLEQPWISLQACCCWISLPPLSLALQL